MRKSVKRLMAAILAMIMLLPGMTLAEATPMEDEVIAEAVVASAAEEPAETEAAAEEPAEPAEPEAAEAAETETATE